MFTIEEKRELNAEVKLMSIRAPLIARKAKPGQFIILRVDENGERIPLTIAGQDPEAGTVTIIFQEVGKTTKLLGEMNVGDSLADFVGPLGTESHLDGYKRACVVGGGLGCAIAFPQAKYLHDHGVDVDIIAGFRSKDIVILEEEMRANCSRLILTTDDGTYGEKGFVTDALKREIEAGNKYDIVIAIGPLIMMKFVCRVTKEYGIKTVISMNPIMLDGTGMCGACRVSVGGETKFACVDGPDFDGHLVDFDEAISRSTIFKDMEIKSKELHECRITGGARNG